MTAGRAGKDGNFGIVERVQWAVLRKPKLLVLRAAIEAYKTNLTLMLSTLQRDAETVTKHGAFDANHLAPHKTIAVKDTESSRPSVRSTSVVVIALNKRQDEGRQFSAFDPRMDSKYTSFLSWILQLEPPSQQRVLRYLKQDIRLLYKSSSSLSGQSNLSFPLKPQPGVLQV